MSTTPSAPVQLPTSKSFTMREVMAVVVLGVVFGFVYFMLVQGWTALAAAMGPSGDLAQNILIGGWMVVAPLALFITRRPGAGIVAEILAAVIEVVFLGSPVGPVLLLSAFVQGAGAELAFALTRYRSYGLPTFICSGLTAAAASFVYCIIRFGWWGQSVFWLRLVLHLASGALLCGLLAFVIARALMATGALRDLPAGRAEAAALRG